MKFVKFEKCIGAVTLLCGLLSLYACGGGGGGDTSTATYTIPFANITVDSNGYDWQSVPVYITDASNDNTGNEAGADLKYIYLSRDNDFLYVLIVLNIANGEVDQSLYYHLRYDSQNDRAIKVQYNFSTAEWNLFTSIQGTPVQYYPSNYLSVFGEIIEFKIPLADVQNEMNSAKLAVGSSSDLDTAMGAALSFD